MATPDRPRALDAGAILEVLVEHGVDFVLVGGIAGMAHGSTYPSFDLDIAYSRDRANLKRLVAALRELDATLRVGGEPSPDPEAVPFQLDLKAIEKGLNFTFDTSYGPLDVLGDPEGISSYRDLAEASIETEIEGHPVRVSSLDHLIAMKRNAGRPKDELMLAEYIVLADEAQQPGDEPTA
jgi:hypothetical protein